MTLSKGKCQVLLLGGNNLRHQDGLGAHQLESLLAEKDLGVMVASKLIMSQQHELVAKKAKNFLGCISQRALPANQRR